MDRARWSNATRVRDSYRRHETAIEGGPLELFIEVSARCNLRCKMCAINFDTRYQPKNGRPPLFSPQLFDRLRPTFPSLLRAHLYGLGEPLLNPHLTDYIHDLSAAGVEVWFTTNATLIDAERAEGFARAGADRISISIDGATAATYETIRRGARFDDLMRGLRALGEARRRYGKPRLTVNFVAMRENFRELPQMIDICHEIGIEEVNVEPLFYWGDESCELDEHYGQQALGDFDPLDYQTTLSETRQRAADNDIYFSTRFLATSGSMDYRQRVESDEREGDWICSEPWATVYVTVAGEVRTCCLNDESFGNLFEQTFAEIWNGDAFRSFRDQHRRQLQIPRGCDNCVKNGRKRHSPYFESVEPVSYRPLLGLSPPPPADRGFRLLGPRDGETQTDPLILHGRLPAAWRWSPADEPAARWPRVYIDRTPVACLDAAAVGEDGRFLMVLPVPYLSEGAHVLSLGFAAEEGTPRHPGWDRRTFHFWRPQEGRGDLAAIDRAAAMWRLPRPVATAAVRIDGRPWSAFSWYCGPEDPAGTGRQHPTAWRGGVLLDLSALAPGSHALEIEPAGQARRSYALEHLQG